MYHHFWVFYCTYDFPKRSSMHNDNATALACVYTTADGHLSLHADTKIAGSYRQRPCTNGENNDYSAQADREARPDLPRCRVRPSRCRTTAR